MEHLYKPEIGASTITCITRRIKRLDKYRPILSNKHAKRPVSVLKTFKESRRFLRSTFHRTEGLGASALYLRCTIDFQNERSLSLVFTAYCRAMKYAMEKGKAAGDDGKRWFIRLLDELRGFSERVRFILYGNDIQTENTGRDRRGSRQRGLLVSTR